MYLKMLSQQVPGRTEESHNNISEHNRYPDRHWNKVDRYRYSVIIIIITTTTTTTTRNKIWKVNKIQI
jgi:hypothetical protein